MGNHVTALPLNPWAKISSPNLCQTHRRRRLTTSVPGHGYVSWKLSAWRRAAAFSSSSANDAGASSAANLSKVGVLLAAALPPVIKLYQASPFCDVEQWHSVAQGRVPDVAKRPAHSPACPVLCHPRYYSDSPKRRSDLANVLSTFCSTTYRGRSPQGFPSALLRSTGCPTR